MISKTLYNVLFLPLGTIAAHAASPFKKKIRDALEGRRGYKQRWHLAAGALADRPVWFHVSSVGEFEQAKPVISSLKKDFPAIPVVLSFCSPSGYRFAAKKENLDEENNIKFIDYMPIDSKRNARFCLQTFNPRLLVFVKFDLWPNLIWEAKAMGIPTLLIDGTLSPSSGRWSRVARRFYRSVYENLDQILAIGEADAARFSESVTNHQAISVAGDTRFDRVMERRNARAPLDIDLSAIKKPCVIAGSTWPKDEEKILPALARLLKEKRDLHLIIAPHEPSADRVDSLTSWASSHELQASPLSRGNKSNQRVTVIDSVGILAELYAFCDMAYIGGSFSTGVHSVIEPAIMGLPVLFGPIHDNSLEALELLKRDGAKTVTNPEEVYQILLSLVDSEQKRASMGAAARSYVESQLGATQRCMKAIVKFL